MTHVTGGDPFFNFANEVKVTADGLEFVTETGALYSFNGEYLKGFMIQMDYNSSLVEEELERNDG